MKNTFHEQYVKLAPIDKLREIGKCYGIQNVKDYKSNNKEELINIITDKLEKNPEQCELHYISSCKQCIQSINRNNVINHYRETHINRKGKEKDIAITDGNDKKYKCNCKKNTELDDTVAVYAHMYKNHNLIKMDKHKQQRPPKEKVPKTRAQKDPNAPKRVRRSNEPRKQKQRTYDEFVAFVEKKFEKKELNTKEYPIRRVFCYPCYKNKKITEIENKNDKIFQHIIHKHQDLFEVQCTQCGEFISSEDNDKITEHICKDKKNHMLVLPVTGKPVHSNDIPVFTDESVTTSFGNFFNSYY